MEIYHLNKLTIVGCGPGSPDYLTNEALEAVRNATILLGSERLLALFAEVTCEVKPCPSHPKVATELITTLLQNQPVTVLVSGDPGLFSLARGLINNFGINHCRIVPGISSIQVAFSRLGIDWRGAKILSAHASDPQWNSHELMKHDNIAILGGRPAAYPWLIEKISALGDQYSVTLMESLTLDNERIRQIEIKDLMTTDVNSLVIIVLQRTLK